MPTFIPGQPRPDAASPSASPLAGASTAKPSRPSRDRVAGAARHGAEAPLVEAGKKRAGRSEIQNLARMAREAWIACGAKAAGQDLDEWRHTQVSLATEGRAKGLRELRRGDFRVVAAAFLDLGGQPGPAFRMARRIGVEDRDQALHLLKEACQTGGVEFPSYPAAICKSQYKCALEVASAKQLMRLVFTVRNRGKAKRRKAPLEKRAHLPAEPGVPSEGREDAAHFPTRENRPRGSARGNSDASADDR